MSQPHFTSDLPPKGLKMSLRVFSSKINFQILTPIFRFRGIPGTPIFFRKFFYENCIFSYISQYIFKNPKTCVKRLVWANNLGSRFFIFDLFDFWGPKKSIRAARLRFWGPQKSKKAKIENRLPKLFAQTSLLTHVFGILKKY